MSTDHLIEKLTNTLDSLALGEGNIKERLLNVYFILSRINPNEIPEEYKSEWESILNQFTRLGPRTSNSGLELMSPLDNTMRKIHKSTGVKIAERIYNLYWKLRETWVREQLFLI